MRIEVAGCDAGSQGSGFLVGPNLVATAAHVIEGGRVIRVVQDTVSTSGEVIGVDRGADVALVRTNAKLSGITLTFALRPPRVGDAVAVLGYTRGDPLSFKPATVNGLDRKAVIDGIPRHSLIEIDGAANHGNSGGPVISAQGTVVGLLDAGRDDVPGVRLAVSSAVAGPLVTRWVASPDRVQPAACGQVIDPNGRPVDTGPDPQGDAAQAITTLRIYFQSINNGDFPTAVAQLASPPPLDAFKAAVTSTQDTAFVVRDVTRENGSPVVWLEFTSHQEPGKGPAARPNETCTRWSQDYLFGGRNGIWLIDRTRAHQGAVRSQPCTG